MRRARGDTLDRTVEDVEDEEAEVERLASIHCLWQCPMAAAKRQIQDRRREHHGVFGPVLADHFESHPAAVNFSGGGAQSVEDEERGPFWPVPSFRDLLEDGLDCLER